MKKILCRSCQAPVFFGRTSKGKRIPIDWEPVMDGNLILGDIAEPSGYPRAFVLGPGDRPVEGTPRYVSHFVTCPFARDHRRR